MDNRDLTGRTAFVTGAASGTRRAIAAAAVRSGLKAFLPSMIDSGRTARAEHQLDRGVVVRLS
jgi:NAD(P)-dependent dehydrogenase (short-subunit alcohol dehydrogenase family)